MPITVPQFTNLRNEFGYSLSTCFRRSPESCFFPELLNFSLGKSNGFSTPGSSPILHFPHAQVRILKEITSGLKTWIVVPLLMLSYKHAGLPTTCDCKPNYSLLPLPTRSSLETWILWNLWTHFTTPLGQVEIRYSLHKRDRRGGPSNASFPTAPTLRNKCIPAQIEKLREKKKCWWCFPAVEKAP